MTGPCASPDAAAAVVPSLASYLECQAQALGHGGFAGVAGTGAPGELLIACLTLFVALIGLRLLAGEAYSLADATRAALRVGLVMVFTLSWPAYQTVFYDVAIQTPGHLANGLLAPLGVRSASVEDTANAFQKVYDALNQTMADRSVAAPPQANPPAAGAAASSPPAANTQSAAGLAPAKGLTPDGKSGLILMVSSLGGLLAMRLATGLLLALGPIVIIFSLFDAMLGLFAGWVTALIGVTLAALFASVVAALELDFLQAVVVPRATTQASAFVDPGLMVTSVIFTLVTLVGFWSAFTLARGFDLQRRVRASGTRMEGWMTPRASRGVEVGGARRPEPASRARLVVDAIRRDGGRIGGPPPSAGPTVPGASANRPGGGPTRDVSWIAPRGMSRGPRRASPGARTISAARRDDRA